MHCYTRPCWRNFAAFVDVSAKNFSKSMRFAATILFHVNFMRSSHQLTPCETLLVKSSTCLSRNNFTKDLKHPRILINSGLGNLVRQSFTTVRKVHFPWETEIVRSSLTPESVLFYFYIFFQHILSLIIIYLPMSSGSFFEWKLEMKLPSVVNY